MLLLLETNILAVFCIENRKILIFLIRLNMADLRINYNLDFWGKFDFL